MASNYYDEAFEPWVRGIHGIAGMMMQAPALRAQAQARQMQAAESQARLGLMSEQTRSAKNKADLEGFNLSELRGLADELGKNTAAVTNEDGTVSVTFRPESIAGLMSRFAGASRSGPDAALSVDRFSKTVNAPGEANKNRANKITLGEAVNKSREKIAMDTPLVLPNQSTAVDKRTGRPVTQGAFTLGPGQQRYGAKSLADAIEPSGPVATVPPLPQSPKSSALEQERTRFIARLEANTDLTPDDRRTALAEFDRKTGYAGPPPNHPPVMGARAKMDANSMGAQPSTPTGPAGSAPAVGTPPANGAGGKVLTLALAKEFLLETGGDKAKARELARQRGYVWE